MSALQAAEEPKTVEPPPRFEPGDRICPGLFAWEQLGAGRRTESWLAWSEPLWTHVVVKLPRDDLVEDVGTARRLGHEARTLRRLTHPAIQRLLDDGHAAPVPHLMLEYVEGPMLATVLEDGGPLAPGDVVRLGIQVATCLHYLHGRGLVHLDLKPGNIGLRDGRAVLLDFDLARPIGGPAPPGRPHGTRAYMAPEQCQRGRAEPRMDLFALGAVLHELATGQAAFGAGHEEAGASEYPQLVASAPSSRALRPGLPPEVHAAIEALLQRRAELRPQTAAEALGLLAAALPEDEEPSWPVFVDGLLDGVLKRTGGRG